MTKEISKIRLYLVVGIMSLAWLAIGIRLVEIQIIRGAEYREIARQQSSGQTGVAARRGLIYDRSGRELAVNIKRISLYAYPRDRNEIYDIYHYLDKVYGWQKNTSRRRFGLKSNHFTWIDRSVPDYVASKILQDTIPGLYWKEELSREYPFGNIGRQLLGATDIDNRGISGLEYYNDSILAGRAGIIDYIRDGKRNTYRLHEVPVATPVPGNSLILTIDWYLQEIVEEELKKAVHEYNAQSGMALFMQCGTGEILAAADYGRTDGSETIKLRAVSDCFEPGSVLKVVTATALLDEDLVDLDEKVYCENGVWQCSRGRLRDDKKYDSLTFQRIIELSSNIGVGKLAQRLGGPRLVKAMKRFGFGRGLMVDIPGEASGSIADPGVWSEYNIAALAMGHSISATALQVASAMAAVADGGRLYRPQIIRGIINPDGEIVCKMDKELISRVANESSAMIIREFLKGVVDSGTAVDARSDIIAIAGKTGTAEVPDRQNGGYKRGCYTASFAGYFPADNPQIAGIVVLDEPQPVHYGGHTSGPAFRNIAERFVTANSDNFIPESKMIAALNKGSFIEIPDLVGRDYSLAVKIAERENIRLGANGNAGMVVWQYPPPHRKIPGSSKIAVLLEGEDYCPRTNMIDLTGMSLRTALAVFEYQGLEYDISGAGIIRKQYPAAGQKIEAGRKCRIVCEGG